MKRSLDVFLALMGLVLGVPVLLGIALLVRLQLGSPVLFRQQRPGLHGRPFILYKFRTMTDEVDAEGYPLSDAERLTPLGRFLRVTSLDELPELINVLRGDMSFVGPRPLLMRYWSYYTDIEHQRHSVRPGITGWAQLQGRNHLGWNDRLNADVWYVQNQSLLLDIRILIMSVVQVLRRKGVEINPGSVMQDLDTERQRRW